MIFEEILVGGCYRVVCEHLSDNVLAYEGDGVCIAKNADTGFVAIAINKSRFLCLRAYSVKKLLYKQATMPGCPDVPMTNYDIFGEVPEAMIEHARKEIAR